MSRSDENQVGYNRTQAEACRILASRYECPPYLDAAKAYDEIAAAYEKLVAANKAIEAHPGHPNYEHIR